MRKKSKQIYILIIIIIALFIGIFISSLLSFNTVIIDYYIFNLSMFVFPLVYIGTLIITELYSFKVTRYLIIFWGISYFILLLFFEDAFALYGNYYNHIFLSGYWSFLISIIAFLIASLISNYIFEKFNNDSLLVTRFLRAILASSILDSVIYFSAISFKLSLTKANTINLILIQITLMFCYQLLFYPILRTLSFNNEKIKRKY